ncbi:MAG TPA: cation:proton antiporter [Vicinamibacterales bacterium]|nr:cation:proton antiporter [Vicinamibacterales bacterium]
MLLSVLLALTVIMVTARLLGAIFKKLNQPAVIGEVIGGIMLGPSLLGRLSPDAQQLLLPADAAPLLGVLAQLGVILYMFLVGLELDLSALRTRAASTIGIAIAGIVIPFGLGALYAGAAFAAYAPTGIGFSTFALFLGVSMSVTAFPVLARILEDRGMQRTTLGITALTCAAISDVIAWCLLAFVVSVTQSAPGGAMVTVALTALYIALMLTAGRRAMVSLIARLDASPHARDQTLPLILAAVLLSAVATEFIGVHAIFGAFLIGAIIPHQSGVAHHVRDRIEDVARVLLLPAFFAFTGLRTEIGLLDTAADWITCATIIAVATAGKLGGTTIAARVTGHSWRASAALGILMNTRGLVELIVLNIGLDLGVISPRLFTMLVLMALVTTMMTSPILSRLNRHVDDAMS